jgi:hypothetical protein
MAREHRARAVPERLPQGEHQKKHAVNLAEHRDRVDEQVRGET